MIIREAAYEDLKGLMELYTELHGNEMPVFDKKLDDLWQNILADKNHHIIVGVINERIISSCVMVIIPNLTHHQQPYALVENVITSGAYRGKGYATAILNYAKDMALNENCYKIMLMTGSKKAETLSFYERAGYNKDDKTAFIQWI